MSPLCMAISLLSSWVGESFSLSLASTEHCWCIVTIPIKEENNNESDNTYINIYLDT